MTLEIYEMAGHLIRRLHQISASIFQMRMREAGYDLTSVQFAALDAIRAYPGVDQATLSGLIAYDRVTIGDVVDRLVAKNYVTRTVSARDRRARELSITAVARRVLEEVTPSVRELQEEILAGLSPEERREFVRLAAKAASAANDRSRAPLMPMGQ